MKPNSNKFSQKSGKDLETTSASFIEKEVKSSEGRKRHSHTMIIKRFYSYSRKLMALGLKEIQAITSYIKVRTKFINLTFQSL